MKENKKRKFYVLKNVKIKFFSICKIAYFCGSESGSKYTLKGWIRIQWIGTYRIDPKQCFLNIFIALKVV